MSHAVGADIDIGMLFVRIIERGAKHLGLGIQLRVYLKPDDRFVFHPVRYFLIR